MVWLTDSEKNLKMCLFVSTEYMNVTDGRTDCHTLQTLHDGIGRYKNYAPAVLVTRAGNASSARRQRRVYCCDTAQLVGSDLPPGSGMTEESLAVFAAARQDLVLPATATSIQTRCHAAHIQQILFYKHF